MTESNQEQNTGQLEGGSTSLTSFGALSGLLALIGASCCVLPLLLINLGVSAALVSHLGVLARWQPWLLGLTMLLLIAGLVQMFRKGRRPGMGLVILFVVAVLIAAAAFIMPYYEADILRWVR
ncbi:hypothetical protein [Parvularcula sp. IMCC14364]|uniref:hypothetical protein n=1 Tax=Parvularcula sp. IMCC14364 TaxID=3067902 RepID=UPI0027405266|nr:hypothetical protein [Parvularcula sp. IMCC14364]